MTTAVRNGIIDLENLPDALEGAEGAISDTAAETESFGEKFTMFKNRMMVALEPLATKIFDSLGAAFERAAPYIESFIENATVWIEQYGVPALQKLFEWAGKIVGYIQQAWPTIQRIAEQVFSALVTAVSAAVSWIQENWPTMQEIFQNVWVVVEEVIGFIVGAVQWFQGVFSDATESTGEGGNSMVETLQSIWDMFVSAFEAIVVVVETAVAIIQAVWAAFGDEITALLTNSLSYVIDTVKNAATVLTGIFDLIKAVLTGKWGEAWDAVKQILSGAWSQVQNMVSAGLSALGTILSTLYNILTQPFRSAFDAVFSFLRGLPGRMMGTGAMIGGALVSGISNAIRGAAGALVSAGASIANGVIGAFKSGWNVAAGWINNKIPNSIGLPFGPSIDLPDNPVPTFAYGGYMSRGGLARVGERGPETVLLPKGAQVKPNHAGGAGEGITVNVTSQADPWEIGDAVAWNLKTAGV